MLLGEYVFYAKHSTTMIIIYMLIYIFAKRDTYVSFKREVLSCSCLNMDTFPAFLNSKGKHWFFKLPNWKVCNEVMVKDKCQLLFTCLSYSAICVRYDDILRGRDNLSAMLKTPPIRLSSYMYALFMHRDFVLQCMMNTPF